MAKDLLIEIGMEEIPARFIRGAVSQLEQKVRDWLNESRIEFERLKSYATPRRIAVLVEGVAEAGSDVREEVRGPSKKIALDEQGGWSKAAQGFARSQGVQLESLFFKEVSGTEYVFAMKESLGVQTNSILQSGLESLITSMTFPKNMRWASYDLRFVRPIRWLVTMFGNDVIPIEIAGVKSGDTTQGHRFLGHEVAIPSPNQYESLLREQFVFADIEERKALIINQIHDLSTHKGWKIAINEDLLEEVLFLVEYPTVLYGGFDPDFLQIPQEVLITSMREHQRYFPVLDDQGVLQPYFVTVRNGNDVSLDQVSRGNEKVLRARLSDARFFYQEDQKLQISSALEKLEHIVFHEELGTVGDKVRRNVHIADQVAECLQVDQAEKDLIHRAAQICKFDLVTQMVYEFPELQGVMGEDYARKAGEKEPVAKAVFEHYQPRFSGDASPASIIGAVVSLADKIDTMVGCFSIGIIPTGSQDPYALRRQAAGIVQIIVDHGLNITLSELISMAALAHEKQQPLKRSRNEINKELMGFFGLRVKNLMNDHIRYDVIDAVLASGFENVGSALRRAEILSQKVTEPSFKTVVDSFTRTANLAAKAETYELDPNVLIEQAEIELYQAWQSGQDQIQQLLQTGQENQALELMSKWQQPITKFFDSVMVMTDDDQLRTARLALLSKIATDTGQFADFGKIVWS